MTDVTDKAEAKLDRRSGRRAIPAPPGLSRASRAKQKLTSPGATIAAVIIAVIWTIPTFGLLVSSFRTPEEIRTNGWWNMFVSPSFTLENYADVLTAQGASSANLGSYFVNSLVIAIPAALFPIILATMAAYAFAWIKFRGSAPLFVLIFALQIVPLQMALIPLLQIFSEVLGISGTFPMTYEGFINGRHWWKVTLSNAPSSFGFTFTNSNGNWNAPDRQYANQASTIYVLPNSATIYTARP